MTEFSPTAKSPDEKVSLLSSIPFIAVHLICLFVIQVGARPRDVLVCIALYYIRMFAVTAGYHRYFSHRTYKTGRVFQFLIALVATTASQKGVLWWAAHHRHHHRYSDQPEDIHSPTLKGFWWSHLGWILAPKYDETRYENIKDFAAYPELRWLNKYWAIPVVSLAVALFFIGGFSMLVWGFFVSTTILWHGTFTINSLSHVFGKRRYKSTDTSRNSFLLALLTCGEGWHNNHHFHQNTANQGWFWWEVDLSYYILKGLSVFGIVRDLRTPSHQTKYAHLKYTEAEREALRSEARGYRNAAQIAARTAATQKLQHAAQVAEAKFTAAKETIVAAAESVGGQSPVAERG